MPIDGHFVGNFFDAFSRTKFAADDTARKKKEAKLTGQLVELQIQNLQNQTTAQNTVAEMLDPQPQEFSLDNIQGPGQEGIGSLTKRPEYSSLVDMLANQGPLLAKAGMLGNAIDQYRVEQSLTDQPSELMEFLKLQAGQQGVDSSQLNLDEQKRTLASNARAVNVNSRADLNTAKDIMKYVNKLSGTILQPGSPLNRQIAESGMGIVAFLSENAGINVAADVLAASQLLAKELEDGVLRTMAHMNNITNIPVFETLRASQANPNMRPEVIQVLIAKTLQRQLDEAEIQGYVVDNRAETEEFIKQAAEGTLLTSSEPVVDLPEAAGKAAETVEEIAGMSIDQLEQFVEDLDINGQTAEVRDAILARADAISGQTAGALDTISGQTTKARGAFLTRLKNLNISGKTTDALDAITARLEKLETIAGDQQEIASMSMDQLKQFVEDLDINGQTAEVRDAILARLEELTGD